MAFSGVLGEVQLGDFVLGEIATTSALAETISISALNFSGTVTNYPLDEQFSKPAIAMSGNVTISGTIAQTITKPTISFPTAFVFNAFAGNPTASVTAYQNLRGSIYAGPMPVGYIVNIQRYSANVTVNDTTEDLGLFGK